MEIKPKNCPVGIDIDKIVSIIKKLGDDFRIDKKLILTECDIQWQICHRLQNHKKDWNKDSNNEYSVHTEIRWSGNEDRQYFFPDIVLLSKEKIEVIGDVREYKFLCDAVIMELKLLKNLYRTDINSVKHDIEKMLKINDLNQEQYLQFLLIIFCVNKSWEEILKGEIEYILKDKNFQCEIIFESCSEI